MRIALLILLLNIINPIAGVGQSLANGDSSAIAISDRTLHFIDAKYGKLDEAIYRNSLKVLQRMQRKEVRLREKLQQNDSVKAKELFGDAQVKYAQLQQEVTSPLLLQKTAKEYIPGLDSIQTAFNFLQQKVQNITDSISPGKLNDISAISGKLQDVQGRMDQANNIQQFIQERERQLKDQLTQYGLGKELLGINKEVFYYRQQLEEYKNIINDKQKLEELVLSKLCELSAFQEFMKNNSYVGRLFSLPQNFNDPATLAGLQTLDQVSQMISQRVGSSVTPSGNSDPTQYFQPQIDQAQGQLNALKNKILQYGGNSSTVGQPDFKPNGQKTKTFLKRITYGFSMQNQRKTNLLPAISNISLSAGYRLTDKSVVGIGGNYLLGLGNGINHIKFTHQGIGARGFIDLKVKGSIWLSGGVEWNYMQSFAKFSDLKKVSVGQTSALIGLSKKYKLSKSKESNMQLLYDALYKQHIPHSQPIIFRLGYSIN